MPLRPFPAARALHAGIHRPFVGRIAIGFLLLGGGCDASAPQPASDSSQRQAYILATVEIGCLTQRETDPRHLARATLEIYRHHGFQDTQQYLRLVASLADDKATQREIANGLKRCP